MTDAESAADLYAWLHGELRRFAGAQDPVDAGKDLLKALQSVGSKPATRILARQIKRAVAQWTDEALARELSQAADAFLAESESPNRATLPPRDLAQDAKPT